jgi:hypothetical protein
MEDGNTGIRAFGAPSIGDFFWSPHNILKMVLPKQFSKVYISFWKEINSTEYIMSSRELSERLLTMLFEKHLNCQPLLV